MTVDETIDELSLFGLRLLQPAAGYRFSLDPLLLCSFAGEGAAGSTAVDLGTGCGVIPLVMVARYGLAQVAGVEFQADMADMARRNLQLNRFGEKASVIEDDLLHLKRHFPVSSFDLVVSNPPYRRPGTGRISPKAGRDIARHESTAGLSDFLSMAKYLVRPGGRICFIYHPSRLSEFLVAADLLKLALVRLRMVHGSPGADARMFLVELTKGRKADQRVEPPLFVYGGDGSYTAEAGEMLGCGS